MTPEPRAKNAPQPTDGGAKPAPRDNKDEGLTLEQRVTRLENRQKRWWESKLIIAALALVVPLTTAVKEYIQKEKEHSLSAQKQEHAFQMEYLGLVTRTDLGLRNRATVLRFFAATAQQPATKSWAKEELEEIDSEEKRFTEELQTHLTNEQKYLKEIADLHQKLRKSGKPAGDQVSSRELSTLIRLTEMNRQEIEHLRRQLDSPARSSTQTTGERFRCITGTLIALGSSEDPEKRRERCLESLAADGTPPDGSLAVSGLSYSWSLPGVSCQCNVSVSLGP